MARFEPGGLITRRRMLAILALAAGAGALEACTAGLGRTGATASPNSILPSGFDVFTSTVRTSRSGSWLMVESNGIPEHPLMTGVRSWQQQVPLPQPYSGDNAWRLPLGPVLAAEPISARHALMTGAIALAVNGIPIFNALNNRGDDSYLAGELDQWGGHCGRADDYHYHVAPLHLQAAVGPTRPIAYALDGLPLYGLTEPDGAAVSGLDELNGHSHGNLGYHYHGTQTYPYLNGGLRGVVQVQGDQVVPQPHTAPIRPAQTPLQGAVITGFAAIAGTSTLTYTVGGATGTVSYRLVGSEWVFDFTDPGGARRTERYPAT